MENHTFCASNYKDQIGFLQEVYNEERNFQLEEERKKNEALYGTVNQKQEESKITSKTPSSIVYKNRIQRQNDLIAEAEGDTLDKEDHVIQLPWTMEAAPTEEELKKRQEMRKEQGIKLKEIMQRKREEKRRKMEEELAVLNNSH